MSPVRPVRLLLLVAVAAVAAVALLQGDAEAARSYEDWTVSGAETVTGESITVSGALTVNLGAVLDLRGCDLTLTNPEEGTTTIRVLGTLVLDGTRVTSLERTRMAADDTGALRVAGTVELLRLDVHVATQGTAIVDSATLSVIGVGPSPGNTVRFDVLGGLQATGSAISIRYVQMGSAGRVELANSTIQALDWGGSWYPRLNFRDGTVVMRDSELRDIYAGVWVDARLTAERSVFTRADLLVDVRGHTTADLRSCTFTTSLVSFKEASTTYTLELSMDDIALDAGRVEVNVTSPVKGFIRLHNLTIADAPDYAIRLRLARGITGALELRDIDIRGGGYGVQVLEDFSGLVVEDVLVDVDTTAFELTGVGGAVPASLSRLRVLRADHGLVALRAVLNVSDSDLLGAKVPVLVEDFGTVKCNDCLLDERAARLSPTSLGAGATLMVHRTMNVSGAYWIGAGPIPSGDAVLEVRNATARIPVPWTIGSEPFPTVRILEWSMWNDLYGGSNQTRIEFHELHGALEVRNHVFKTPEPVDPWQDGPFALLFEDDMDPEISIDASVRTSVNEPRIPLSGTVGDLGSGLEFVSWVLMSDKGENVSSGSLSHGRWSVSVDLTANYQRVRIEAWDASGNHNSIFTSPILVDVAPPSLTVLSPQDGELTNSPYITVSGRAESYANVVEVVIGEHTYELPVDAEGLFYSAPIRLPYEGLVEILATSHDPFGNEDPKRIVVTFDMTPPLFEIVGLREDGPNYVNVPVLVVMGTVDDARARVRVADQVVGVLEADRSFATSVELHEGRQTVRVEAWDPAGNRNAVNLEVVLDTVAPVITVVSPSSNPFYTAEDSVTVEVFTSESLSRVTRDGIPMTMTAGRLTFRHDFPSDGKREFVLVATDLAGNEGRLAVVLVRDTEPPRLTIISPNDGAIVNRVTQQLVVHSSEVGCALLVNGVERELPDIGANRLTTDLLLLGGDGPRTISLTLRDRAGNLDRATLYLELDTQPPGIALDDLVNGSRVTTEPLRVRGRTEPLAKVVWVNGLMARLEPDGSFSTSVELPEGEQVLTIRVEDKAGNDGAVNITLEVLAAPRLDVPWEAAAAGTILAAFGALFASTEMGRWGLVTLFLPLYTKLRKDRILDQRTRGLIQGYILANPGCNYTLLRDNLDLADGTLTYHLQVLEREGFVYSIREGLFRCFYPTGLPPPRRGKLHLSDTQADIVRICKRIPGITVGEIATAMNRRPNVISYHLKLLREGGLITLEEDGRHVRVYPVEAAVAMI